jgi:hypothetical protein
MPNAGDITYASDVPALVARGNRPSTKATAGSTVEIGYLRLDGVAVRGGWAYKITCPRLRFGSTVSTDHGKFHVRINDAGTATTSSTIWGRAEDDVASTMHLEVLYTPTVDDTVSILLSFVRTSAGAGVCTIQSDEKGVDMLVEVIGIDPGDTGIDA